MNKKSLIGLAMILMVPMAALTGCGDEGSGEAGSGNNDTLQAVLQRGTLRVGILSNAMPMSYTDESGKEVGYDVDTAQALADALGVKVELVDITAPERIPALETHKVDIVIGSFTRNVSRAAKVAFSDPYMACATKIMVDKGSSITASSTVEDLKGKTIGAVKGSSTAEAVDAINPDHSFDVFLGETIADLNTALDNGQIDGYAADGSIIDYRVKEAPDKYQSGFAINDPFYNSLGVRLDDTIWLNYVNTFIKEKNKDHFFNTLYNKYFGTNMPYSLTPVY